jgi:transcriptional regulator with XRE-family HTH domain
VEEMSLLQLRKARELTQTKIADELHMGQGDVSKLERRTDMYVSTLASYLQAVGADLEIRAVFSDGRAVKITQFLRRVDHGSSKKPLNTGARSRSR